MDSSELLFRTVNSRSLHRSSAPHPPSSSLRPAAVEFGFHLRPPSGGTKRKRFRYRRPSEHSVIAFLGTLPSPPPIARRRTVRRSRRYALIHPTTIHIPCVLHLSIGLSGPVRLSSCRRRRACSSIDIMQSV